MNINYQKLKKKNIVYIADRVKAHAAASLTDLSLEMTEESTFKAIEEALGTICRSVIHYDSPTAFERNIEKHSNDIVLSTWSGQQSRNRKSLVPSICEANNICYMGSDAYVQLISQDKQMSKLFCKSFEINSPSSVSIISKEGFHQLDDAHYPLVIKPNYEGGSMGISNRNLVRDMDAAKYLVSELLPVYGAVLAEQFVPGIEACICINGVQGTIDVFEAVSINLNGKDFLDEEIYGYEYKKASYLNKDKKQVTGLITPELRSRLLDLYWGLGKVEFMRIDGRFTDTGEFMLIELSPDCSLSPKASTATAFKFAGYSYIEMFAIMIQNACLNWEHQNASMK